MPPRPQKPCRKAGCSRLTQEKNGFCADHQALAVEAEKARLSSSWKAAEKRRGSAADRGYDGKWRKERVAYLKENPLCLDCLDRGQYVPATIIDHIIPHRGDMKLFWRRSNWRASCKPCHDKKTARGE